MWYQRRTDIEQDTGYKHPMWEMSGYFGEKQEEDSRISHLTCYAMKVEKLMECKVLITSKEATVHKKSETETELDSYWYKNSI